MHVPKYTTDLFKNGKANTKKKRKKEKKKKKKKEKRRPVGPFALLDKLGRAEVGDL